VDTDLPRLAFQEISQMSFEPLEQARFPAFATVLQAAEQGGTAPAAINGADEVLVQRFLAGDIPFTGIARGLDAVLSRWPGECGDLSPANHGSLSLEKLLAADRWARETARELSF
jgi:1-deoxy-D-xylulose-5-phosphate reductoisomerase